MDAERMERAQFAAELRRKGTLLSDEAIADVCEAFLELADDGSISLELHEQISGAVRAERDQARADFWEAMKYIDQAKLAAQQLGRIQGEPLDEFLRRLAVEGLP